MKKAKGKIEKFNITRKQIERLKRDIADIERWRGDAYENDDEVGRAVQDIKVVLSTMIYGDTNETCPHCDMDHEINRIDFPCPSCGKTLVACSLCSQDYNGGCGKCPDGTSKNFDLSLDMI